MTIRECALCGKEFDNKGNSKLCPECKVQPCVVCGKPVKLDTYKTTQMIQRGWVTCSVQCGGKMGGEKQRGRRHDTKKAVVCDMCGKEFVGKGGSKTCDECKTVRCAACGAEIKLSGAKLSKYKRQVKGGDSRITCGNGKCRAWLTKTRLVENEGISNVSDRSEVKEKIRQVRFNESDETKEKRARSLSKSCGSPESVAKRRAAMIEKTGYGSRMENPEIHKMMLEKAAAPESRKKAQDTHALHYDGAKTPFQRQDVKDAMIARRREKKEAIVAKVREYLQDNPNATPRKICRCVGVKYHALLQYNREFNLGINLHHSSYEELFRDALLERGIDYEREYRMQVDGLNDRRNCPRYDFLVGNTLIEIDPWHYHNATFVDAWYEKELEPHEPSYHLKKSRYAMEHEGKRCVHVFDWDDYEMVADMFIEKRFVNACDLELATFDGTTPDIGAFLNENHLQGACKGVMFASALLSDGEVVAVMTFGRPRYNKKYDWELLRYCTKTGMAVRGGSEALWGAFVSVNDGSVVSYCDNAKFGGRVYEKLGFNLDDPGETPHLHWYNPDTGQHFTAAYVNQLGVDKILGTDYGKGTKNDELMLKEGFVEIYDCGQSRWVYPK